MEFYSGGSNYEVLVTLGSDSVTRKRDVALGDSHFWVNRESASWSIDRQSQADNFWLPCSGIYSLLKVRIKLFWNLYLDHVIRGKTGLIKICIQLTFQHKKDKFGAKNDSKSFYQEKRINSLKDLKGKVLQNSRFFSKSAHLFPFHRWHCYDSPANWCCCWDSNDTSWNSSRYLCKEAILTELTRKEINSMLIPSTLRCTRY